MTLNQRNFERSILLVTMFLATQSTCIYTFFDHSKTFFCLLSYVRTFAYHEARTELMILYLLYSSPDTCLNSYTGIERLWNKLGLPSLYSLFIFQYDLLSKKKPTSADGHRSLLLVENWINWIVIFYSNNFNRNEKVYLICGMIAIIGLTRWQRRSIIVFDVFFCIWRKSIFGTSFHKRELTSSFAANLWDDHTIKSKSSSCTVLGNQLYYQQFNLISLRQTIFSGKLLEYFIVWINVHN